MRERQKEELKEKEETKIKHIYEYVCVYPKKGERDSKKRELQLQLG